MHLSIGENTHTAFPLCLSFVWHSSAQSAWKYTNTCSVNIFFSNFLRRFFFFALVFFVFILNYWHKMASLFIRSGCKSFYSSQRYLLSISFLLFLCFLVVFFSSTIPFGSSCSMEIERERESTHKKNIKKYATHENVMWFNVIYCEVLCRYQSTIVSMYKWIIFE